MKCVPIFFLVGFSVLHLIHVIAIPNAKRSDLARLEARRAAAMKRFIKSKKYAPFKSPWKRRHAALIYFRKYANFLKAVTKRYLRSANSRLETHMTGLRENIFRTLGRDLAVLRSYKSSHPGRYWEKQSTGINGRYQTLFKSTAEGEADENSARSTIQFTTSVYELFRQVVQEELLRIQSLGTGPDTNRGFKSLKDIQRKQAERDELTSRTFVPIPSEAPFLQPTPGTYPQPSARESISQTVEDHGMVTLPGSVLTFRRLARFAARI